MSYLHAAMDNLPFEVATEQVVGVLFGGRWYEIDGQYSRLEPATLNGAWLGLLIRELGTVVYVPKEQIQALRWKS